MEWQPIETAPKDGTPVLIFWSKKYIGIGEHAPEDAFFGAYWWAYGTGKCNPSHWMPLPPPPKDAHAAK